MGVSKNTFRSAGQISQHSKPGGYSRIDTPRGKVGLVSANRGVIVGPCAGGKPNELLWFNTINDAINTLRSGALLDAVRFALNPGGELVPQMIGAVRVNTATQSTGTFKDINTDDIMSFKSRDYGIYTNNIKRSLSAGSVAGKKLTVMIGENGQIIDNIYKESIKIQYAGDGITAVMDIIATQIDVVIAGQTDDSVSITILFSEYDTIEKVVGYINSQVGYSCTLVDGADGTDASSEIDAVEAQDVKSAVYTITSNVQAMIDAINNQSEYLSDAVLGVNGRQQLENDADIFISGGTEGVNTISEHASALSMLEHEDLQAVGSTTEDYAIQNTYKTHVAYMNSVTGKKERQTYLGALVNESFNTAIVQAKIWNEKAVNFCYGQHDDYDLNGKEKTYSSVYYASKMLGQFCALDIIQPHTFKEFNAIRLASTVKNLTLSQQEQAIEAGLWIPEVSPQGTYRTVRSVTTYQKDNLIWNEASMARTALFVSRDFRTYLETLFTGKAGDTTLLQSIETMAKVKLNEYRNDSNFFVDNPSWGDVSWRNLTITVNGDQVRVDYDATITAPVNFLFITNKFSVIATI